jgi:hypothetical protein
MVRCTQVQWDGLTAAERLRSQSPNIRYILSSTLALRARSSYFCMKTIVVVLAVRENSGHLTIRGIQHRRRHS